MNSWKILLNSLTEFQWFIFILGHYLQLPMKTISWRKVTIVSTLKNNSHKYTSFLQANMFSKSGTLQEKYKDSLKTVMENSRRLVNAFSNLYHDASHKSSAHGDADVSFPICCMSSHIFEYETLLECPNFICNFIYLWFFIPSEKLVEMWKTLFYTLYTVYVSCNPFIPYIVEVCGNFLVERVMMMKS